MRASIISVGSEILRGTLLDTNSHYFAQELQAIGTPVVRMTQVQDDLDAIVAALSASCEISEIIIMSGGLGPTEDDLSREAVIALTDESPTVNQEIVSEIRARFELRGDVMPQRNEKQAWQIPSAHIVPNPHGTAPGWIVEHAGATIALLPGPPRENRPMWTDYVRPRLVPMLSDLTIVSRTIKTIGIGESAVADRLDDLISLGWPEVATYAKQDGVQIAVTAAHPDMSTADAAVRSTVSAAVQALGNHVYGFGNDSLAAAITQPLAAASAQIAIWEVGSAGTFINMLMADNQAAPVVADARIWSGQPAGRMSVRDLAREATRTTGVGIAAAIITEIDEPESAVTDGTVDLALAHAGTIVDASHKVRGAPDEIRRRSALLAAEFLWTEIRSAAGILTNVEPSSPSART